jgi:hypothetical protein
VLRVFAAPVLRAETRGRESESRPSGLVSTPLPSQPPSSEPTRTPAPRDYANETLTGTKYTHAVEPRAERCFLCRYVQEPPTAARLPDSGIDLFERPEAGIVQRMRSYWETNVQHVDFQTLADDCARIFRHEYQSHWLPPAEDADAAMTGASEAEGQQPSDCVADADMVYAHFMRHECTPATRRAVLKRVYSDTFEFLESNKRNGFSKGRNGKRVPNAAAEAAHTKGSLVLLKIGAYLDRSDREEK